MIRAAAALAALCLLLAPPAPAQEAVARFGPQAARDHLVLRTTTDLARLGPTIETFVAARPGTAVTYEQWGSNDLFQLQRAECAAGRPGADIVISSAVHQMVRLVNDRCAAPYRSGATALLPADLRWRDEIWGLTREPAVIVYNRRLVPDAEVPNSRFDLLDLLRRSPGRYAGRVATYDIETSGLGFLFAFMDAQEATTFGALMEAFGRSGAVATCCSAEIIAGVADGRYLLAYNVLGSYAAAAAETNPALGIVAPADYTLILSRAALLPRRDRINPAATALLDFMLSTEGQIALARGHMIRSGATDRARWADSESGGSARLIALTPALLVALDRQKRSAFIRRWRDTFGG